jgi:hypothetical protein
MAKTNWESNQNPVFTVNRHGAGARPGRIETTGSSQGKAGGHRRTGYMPYYVDASDSMANKGFYVSFQHAPSEEDVNFKAFITAFNESYNCDWASEQVYGRADPIYMFKQNTREITLALNIPAATVGEAFDNLNRVQRLVTFLYPTYDDYLGQTMSSAPNQPDTTNALTMTNSPLIRLRVMNLLAARPQIGDGLGGDRETEAGNISTIGHFDNFGSGQAEWRTSNEGSNRIAGNFHGGLLGIIKNMAVNHNLDNPDHGVFEMSNGTILPKMIDINITFAAIHEHTLGWIANGDGQQFSNGLFPYGTREDTSGVKADDFGDVMANRQKSFENTENIIDNLDEQKELTEQQRMQAEARYAGMFGKMRANNDASRIDRSYNRATRRMDRAMEAAGDGRTGIATILADSAGRAYEHADYLEGTRGAAGDVYGDDFIE